MCSRSYLAAVSYEFVRWIPEGNVFVLRSSFGSVLAHVGLVTLRALAVTSHLVALLAGRLRFCGREQMAVLPSSTSLSLLPLSIRYRQGRYSEGQAARIMWEVAEAVGFLHTRGIVHFDLKPENIMLGECPHACCAPVERA